MCTLSMNAHVSTLVLVGAGTCSVCVSVCPVGLHVSSWTLVQEVVCALVQGCVHLCVCMHRCDLCVHRCVFVCICVYPCVCTCTLWDKGQSPDPQTRVSCLSAESRPQLTHEPQVCLGGPSS